MLPELDEILDRYEQPACRGTLPVPPARSASATNPRCGDVVTIYAEVCGDRLGRVRFEGAGCTISQVAADVAAEVCEGTPIAEARQLPLAAILQRLGPVRTRLDCAALGLRTLQRLLAAAGE